MKIIEINNFVENELENLIKMYPLQFYIKRKISKGDLIKKSISLIYEIDNEDEIMSKLKEHKDGFPYGHIHRLLKSDQIKLLSLFDKPSKIVKNRKIIPFTSVIREEVGECLEKAILTQLFLQKSNLVQDRLFVSGGLACENEYVEYHAYNLAKINKEWFLIDTENPYPVQDGKTVPFFVKIKKVNIKNDYSLELEIKSERTYYLKN